MTVATHQSKTNLKVGYDPQAKQVIAELLSRYAKHTLFGGAAGPGKTAWLCNKAAVRLATYPGTHVLIGRRTNKELKSIARTIMNWLPKELYKFNANQMEFVSTQDSPIGPGWIRLRQFFREEDVTDHLGEEYDLIELDEATGFTQYQRNLLRSRNRHPLYGDDCSMAYASNPGGAGHHDFLNEFVRPKESNVRLLYYWDITAPTPPDLAKYGVVGNIRRFPEGWRGKPAPCVIWQPDEDEAWWEINEQRALEDLPPIEQASRVYVPGLVSDNKYIWEMNPDYVAELMALPEKMRDAYLKGNWDAFEGQVFEEFDPKVHVIDLPNGVEDHWTKWRSMDWGYRAETAVLWHAYSPELQMIITYRELYQRGMDDLEATTRIKELTPRNERVTVTWADPKMFSQEGFEGMTSHAEYYEDQGVRLERANNRRLDGWQRLHSMMSINSATKRPRWACTSDCRHLIRTLPVLVYEQSDNKVRAEDVDCFVAGTMVLTVDGEKPIEQVQVGDFVETPIGPRRVIKSGPSGIAHITSAEMSNGRVLVGTPNHKVYVLGRGLVPLAELRISDILGERRITTCSKWSTTALRTHAALADGITSRMARISQRAIPRFIGRSISTIMAASPLAIISTIGITTMTTTASRTWRPSPPAIMPDTTWNTAAPRRDSRSNSIGGIALMRGASNSKQTPTRCWHIQRKHGIRAELVAYLERRNRMSPSCIALTHASTSGRSSTGIYGRVRSAALSLVASATQRSPHKPVRIRAAGNYVGVEMVYNLTVEDAHLYYANGVLVTNTTGEDHLADALRYGIMAAPSTMLPRARKPPTAGAFWTPSARR